MRYCVYNKSTGRIVRNILCQETDLPLQFNPLIEGYLLGYFDDSENYVVNEQIVALPPKPFLYYEFNWDTKQWFDPRTSETQWYLVKNQRDNLLSRSDWTQMPDVAIANKTNWATYRQALRDITTQADPYNIVWPVPPGG